MLILSGKSCVGKDTILKELIKLGMKPIISYTTRDKRPSETDGVEYHFISDEEFEKKENEDFFIETTEYKTKFGLKKYGTSKSDIKQDNVMILNPEGVLKIKETLGDIYTKVFYIKTDDDIIWQRTAQRGDDLEEAARRIDADNSDFDGFEEIADYIIHNDSSVELVANMIYNIYLKEKNVDN